MISSKYFVATLRIAKTNNKIQIDRAGLPRVRTICMQNIENVSLFRHAFNIITLSY